MITENIFNEQLTELNHLFKRWSKTCFTYLSQSKSSQLLVTFTMSNEYNIELEIIYDDTYHEPTLVFRIFNETEEENGIYCTRHVLLNNEQLGGLLNLENHSITLITRQDNREVWYRINNCDTGSNVGSDPRNYLRRWISSYMAIFDGSFNELFIYPGD